MKWVKKVFLAVLFGLLMLPVCAQSDRGFFGKEFWLTFTENLYQPTDLVVYVAPETTDTITIFNPQTNATLPPVQVKPGMLNAINIPASYVYSILTFGPQGTGVVVKSKREVQVYASNTLNESRDMTAVLPVEYLRNAQEYLVNTWGGQRTKESQVAILAIDTGITKVTIKLSADLFTGQGAGSTISISLQRGQVYLLQSLDTQSLSGTLIKVSQGCKRLAVFQGVKSAKVNNQSSCISYDHLFEQAWPTVYWGKQFFIPAIQNNNKFQLRFVALFDNTNLTTPAGTVVINRGQAFTGQFNTTSPLSAIADKPVSCIQVSLSYGCNGSLGAIGDASMMNIAPVDLSCYTRKAKITIDNDNRYRHFITIVVRSSKSPVVKLNGSLLAPTGGYFPIVIGGTNYYWGWFEAISTQFNEGVLQSDSGFCLYQHGLAPYEAFSMCVAASLQNRRADFTINPTPLCRGSQLAYFKATGDSMNGIRWEFPGGAQQTGNPVSYAFGKPGFYSVKMLNTTNNSCPVDTVVHTVRVTDVPERTLPFDTTPCKGSVYRIQLPVSNELEYSWEDGSTTPLQTILANRIAILTIKDTNGCMVKDTIKVTFKECGERDLRLANVFTPNNDEKNDGWRVEYKGWDSIRVQIFSRWGVKVAGYSLPSEEHWNGRVMNNGPLLPEGTYFYWIWCFDRETQTEKTVSGSINLIR